MIISFRVGAGDAKIAEEDLYPSQEDFTNLPKYQIYLRLLIDRIAGDAFSAETLPPCENCQGNEEKIIRVSRERYAKSRKDVEEKINRWSC